MTSLAPTCRAPTTCSCPNHPRSGALQSRQHTAFAWLLQPAGRRANATQAGASTVEVSAGRQGTRRTSTHSTRQPLQRHQQLDTQWQPLAALPQQPQLPSSFSSIQPDPAADDLDALVAAAAAPAAPAAAGNGVGVRTGQGPASLPLAARVPLAITSIQEARSPYQVPPGRTPRYTALDKLQLSGEAMRDIAVRLRRPRRGRDSGKVLRVFR